VIGTTWIQAMLGSQELAKRFNELTRGNPHQIESLNKEKIIETLKARVDSGGMLVVNQDIYLVDPIGAKFADIIFPAATWGEEDFLRANGERRVRLYQKFYDAPGQAKPDWWIIGQLATRMGFPGFDWETSSEVADELAKFTRGSRKDFYMVKIAGKKQGKTVHEMFREMGTTGIQAPVYMNDDGTRLETTRLHDTTLKLRQDGPTGLNMFNKKLTAFNSQTGRCNLQKSPWNLFSDYWEWMKPKGDEMWCTSGRSNERWQSGFDDTRRPYIQQRWPENWVEIHPNDAAKRGIESGDMVMLSNDRVPSLKNVTMGVEGSDFSFTGQMAKGNVEFSEAAVTAVAIVTRAVKEGVLYSDFLQANQPINALAGRVVDWISGNYNYKMGIGKITKIGESPYKHSFRSMSFAPRDIVI